MRNLIDKNKDAGFYDWLVLGPLMSDPQEIKWEINRFPLYLHIMGAVCCLGFSATFHHFKDMSRETSERLSRLDYAGISMLIAGSNMPPIYYSFYCQPLHCKLP